MAIFQVRLDQSLQGQEVKNILYYETVATEIGGGDAQDLADTFRAIFAATAMSQARAAAWTLDSITLRRVDQAGWPSYQVGFTNGSLSGTGGGEALPNQAAMLYIGTVYSQPPNRVRTYIAGLNEGQTTLGLWEPAAIERELIAWDSIRNMSAGGFELNRVSVKWAPDNSFVTDWNVITNSRIEAVPATQRRRRIGRGN